MCLTGACGMHGPLPGRFAYSAFSADLDLPAPRALSEITAMSPEDMARASRMVMGAYSELLNVAGSLENEKYRQVMMDCITGPKVTFLEMYKGDQDRRRLFDEMVRLGFFNKDDDPDYVWPAGHMNPQTYLTAPQSHNDFYNAHPGGLAITVAYNIRMADAYTANYRQMYGLPISRDLPAAALCIHEYPKVWLYQWQTDGSWLEEPRTIFDDSWHAHCIYVTAEMMHRRLDARMVTAVAAAHLLATLDAGMDGRNTVNKWLGLEKVADFIHAASVMAQVDPVDYGILERKGGKLVLPAQPAEQWVTHMADMNWPYAMGAAHLFTEPMLKQIAVDDLGISANDLGKRPFNQLKNYVWSQIGQIPLYEILVREGFDAARATVLRLVKAH